MRTLNTLTNALRTQHGRHQSLLLLLEATRLEVKHDRVLDTDKVAELDQRDANLDKAARRLDEAATAWNQAKATRTTVTLAVLEGSVDKIDNLLNAAETLITGTTPVPVPAPSPVPVVIPVPAPVATSGGSGGNGGGDDDIQSRLEAGLSDKQLDLLAVLVQILPDNTSIEKLNRALALAGWTFKLQGKNNRSTPAHS